MKKRLPVSTGLHGPPTADSKRAFQRFFRAHPRDMQVFRENTPLPKPEPTPDPYPDPKPVQDPEPDPTPNPDTFPEPLPEPMPI